MSYNYEESCTNYQSIKVSICCGDVPGSRLGKEATNLTEIFGIFSVYSNKFRDFLKVSHNILLLHCSRLIINNHIVFED
jgi:hypothetical protein